MKPDVRHIAARLSKDPRLAVRAILGALLLANLVAAAIVFKPWGGSPEDLQRELAQLRAAARQRQETVERLRGVADKVEKARSESDRFLDEYFLDRRTTYSNVASELSAIAQEAGLKPKEHSLTVEPVEGSDTLAMLIIAGHYEGAYGDLIKFVNLLDRSPRFLTIESMQATPQQGTGTLNVNLKLSVFMREGGPAL
jgi:type IV pilus assembly protein PilO